MVRQIFAITTYHEHSRVADSSQCSIAYQKGQPQAFHGSLNTPEDPIEDKENESSTLNNERTNKITLHTFHHWKATMEYHRTKDILHVKQLLGHKQLKNTEIYTHLIDFENDEWDVAHAKNLEEEDKLIEAGFEYVRYSQKFGVAIYRKRK